ncbi:AAA family ATPase [Halorubrum yunnanense]|uniref:AAA family ATPase n=1 Tax=Halorubrum yunnanense TaxID=1526162 RepID=A0ABD5YEL9_9EURY|nr:AAA family ATPase [Halorubrum yunnanense]
MSNRDAADGAGLAGADSGTTASAGPVTDHDADPAAATDAEGPEAEAGALAVVCGLPGVGKTTVAERVAAHLDGEILRTDVIRKELFGDPEYTDAETEAVYAELIDRARERVVDGDAVVLDATFADARFRADVRETGERAAASFDLVEVECDEAVVERRIERRDGISDADFEVHLHFRDVFDRIETDHAVVDNSGDEAATLAQVDAAFDDSVDEASDGAVGEASDGAVDRDG